MKLSLLKQWTKPVAEFIQQMRSTADELAMAQSPVHEDDLIIFILNELGVEFREISTVIRARDSAISLEKLYDKLTDIENDLQQDDVLGTSAVSVNFAEKGKGNNCQQNGNTSQQNRRRTNQGSGNYNNKANLLIL